MSVHRFSKTVSYSIVSVMMAVGLSSTSYGDQTIAVSFTAVPDSSTWRSGIDGSALAEATGQPEFVVEVLGEFDELPGLATAFREAVKGAKLCLAACAELGDEPISIVGSPSTSDMLRILMATKYGSKNASDYRWDAIARIDSVISRLGPGLIRLEGKDKEYLVGPFRQIVEQTMSASGRDFPNVVALIDRGFDGKSFALDGLAHEYEPLEIRELSVEPDR